ncbi:hypothetical protein BFW01_g7161 [Lasiodiplodia theobromae]|uniref:DUF7888 domain-containing protein n=1 Tax=Lasiodiplodia theobromae TaxID=45133 RepID=A0A5N5DFC3_9PEZI|nr:uncharacterized protein LTHEOB_4978 [Lasiodiplodia theobromae]KAB2576190.1 hypothetical protein DBV05_g5165 [Lasiodiplodia theobromae]KAF4545719.1 hypothetical protein LTHEOB_4978 [Lasiodiplodia theobromae]KAF9636266.1 hypothetical protein BFW01_g7161 [Lasiodiplodia theobromae]
MASAIAVTILTGAASAVISAAINQVAPTIANLGKWDEAREAFTQQTVKAMWDAKTEDYGAAVCYNMGYEVSNTNQMYEKTSVMLEQELLHTDYDCFFMSGPDNHFWTYGDGGYINLAIYHDSSKCWFDSNTSDLYCP